MSFAGLKNRILNRKNGSDITSFFYLIKELGLGDLLLGKDYEGEFELKGEKIPFKFRQKPLKMSQVNVLLKELNEHYKRENKANRKGKR